LTALDFSQAKRQSARMKVVFDTRPGSGYRDTVGRYHFPSRYLQRAQAAIGDWAIYYEPQRENGRRAYVAVAWVERIEPDLELAGHHFAIMRDYLPFDAPVSLRGPAGYREARLRDVSDPSAVGRALQGNAVRELLDEDFVAIIEAGLQTTLSPDNAVRLELAEPDIDPTVSALLAAPPSPRTVERMLVNRTIRDASFRRAVLSAYDDTCAVTGLRIINGGGKAEAQAAHIWPVADGGPDVVQNGLALSSTAHWLFDRHLITIGEDWRLLVSHNKVPKPLRALLSPPDTRIRLPVERSLWPHPEFVARHRERYAGG
jgi:putative restriction endonuclease